MSKRVDNSTADQSGPCRVLFVGAECSGKTSLCEALAAEYQCWQVPEYFRFYWQARRYSARAAAWQSEAFVHLAQVQNQLEDSYAVIADRLLVLDTDALNVAAYHNRYLGFWEPRIEALYRQRPRHLVYLCQTDIPFVQDGVRDGEAIRHAMSASLAAALEAAQIPYTELRGSLRQRLEVVRRDLARILPDASSAIPLPP